MSASRRATSPSSGSRPWSIRVRRSASLERSVAGALPPRLRHPARSGAPTGDASTAELVAQGLRVSRGGAGDAVLDRRARADGRERLADLHRELGHADAATRGAGAHRARLHRGGAGIVATLGPARCARTRRSRREAPSRLWQIATRFLAPPDQGPPPDRPGPRKGGYPDET